MATVRGDMPKKQDGNEGREYITGEQAAKLMGVHPRTVYRKIEKGEIIATHGKRNRLRIALDDVKAWIAKNQPETDPLGQVEELSQCSLTQRLARGLKGPHQRRVALSG